MTQPTNIPSQQPAPAHPYPAEEVSKQKQKAETKEVAGRHKNEGQKDHKGAR
jgi:hypothetical protein